MSGAWPPANTTTSSGMWPTPPCTCGGNAYTTSTTPATTPCATTATATSTAGTASGGTSYTVIVAPTQGVLRYVPFVVNASVGDTIVFLWNANNHTVTKSSQLAICNKTMDAPFASGEQNKSFVFQQTVNSTNSTYFYCGTPGHCQKGMFGIINPPNAAMGSNMSLSGMMPAMAANSSSMGAMWQYTQMATQNNSMASGWGGNIDMSGMPQWAYQSVAENVMYTRTFLAANPETLNEDGSVTLGNAGSTPLMVPADITSVQNGSASSPGSSSTQPANSSPHPTTTSGAAQLLSSKVVAGFTVAFALIFIL
ncbi:hypothetical protein BKA83DRAFT_4243494 [Pisolithus microcarpus]|nr:hypothetical protein BKA83DRAFT_4243494 [Pisolithus microcarpus]